LDRLDRVDDVDAERSGDDRGVRKTKHTLRLSFGRSFLTRDYMDRPSVTLLQCDGVAVVAKVRLPYELSRRCHGVRETTARLIAAFKFSGLVGRAPKMFSRSILA
jgi:hypothetical protein